jgi:hypothetical protein
MAIFMGRMPSGPIVRTSTRRSTGAGFWALRTHGADATSDTALKSLISLTANTSV